MVDAPIDCHFFGWGERIMDTAPGKESMMSDGDSTSPFDPRQTYLNFCLGSNGEADSESLKSSSPDSACKSPKTDINLNNLQHDQERIIQQRINERSSNLRNLNVTLSPPWPVTLNTYPHRAFANLDMTSPTSPTAPCFLTTNPIPSCMFGPNRVNPWFNRMNMVPEPWPADYNQDPTMRSRPCFSSHQTRELEREFNLCQYITRRRRIELACALSLTEKQIKTWFQNRRVKERKQKKSISTEQVEDELQQQPTQHQQ